MIVTGDLIFVCVCVCVLVFFCCCCCFLYLVASAQISLVSQIFSGHVSYHVPTDDWAYFTFPDILLITCELLKTNIGITHELHSAW